MTARWYSEHYHSPSDDLLQPLDFNASKQLLALIATLALEVADADLAPEWKPGVPYAYRRLLSLAEEERSK